MNEENKSPIIASEAVIKATNDLLDEAIRTQRLKNDAALSRALEVAPPVISKLRKGKLKLGAENLIRLHELTGWAIRTMKVSLGQKCLESRAA